MKITIETSEPRILTPEQASFRVKFLFCFFGLVNLGFGILFLFGPWWAKGFSIFSLSCAVLCFNTAYKEHKDSFFKKV